MDNINFNLVGYFWFTYNLTLVGLLYIPSKLDRGVNLMGSLLLSLLGFVIWPIVLVAAIIAYRRKAPKS